MGPYLTMLLTPVAAAPAPGGFAHECKLDGWLAMVSVVAVRDRQADFDLLGARLNGRSDTPRSTFYVFDVLQARGAQLIDRPWTERRKWLDDLDLEDRTGGLARPTVWSPDEVAMHRASAEIGAEGTVSKTAHLPVSARGAD